MLADDEIAAKSKWLMRPCGLFNRIQPRHQELKTKATTMFGTSRTIFAMDARRKTNCFAP
jgi:hypothetical protein